MNELVNEWNNGERNENNGYEREEEIGTSVRDRETEKESRVIAFSFALCALLSCSIRCL